jgi:hypothetical protein
MSAICSVPCVTTAQMHALWAKPTLVSKLALVAQIDLLKAHIDDLTQRLTPEQRAQFETSQAQFAASLAAKQADPDGDWTLRRPATRSICVHCFFASVAALANPVNRPRPNPFISI